MRCETFRLGDICTFIDYRGKTPPKTSNGIPLVTAKIIKNSMIQEPQEFIAENYYNEWMRRGIPQKGDVIFTTEAPLGEVARIKTDDKLAFAQRIIVLEPNTQQLNAGYLFYALQDIVLKNRIAARATGTTVIGIKAAELKKVEIDLPPLQQQEKIADILSSLDDKIELNNKINENLERQAQAIFRSWFLDCLPFNSIKPTHWKFCTLGETTKMSAGGDKPKGISNIKSTEYPYPIYSNGLDNEGLYGYTNEAKIFAESVTVSARGTIGFVCLRHIPYVPIVRLVTLIPNENLISAKYLYLYLKQLRISGTGTTQQQLTVPDFRKTEILIPDKITMDKFTNLISPMFNQIWANGEENIKLASLRDSLLPKLMSGEIEL